jgi:hypothetical protein
MKAGERIHGQSFGHLEYPRRLAGVFVNDSGLADGNQGFCG